jgi:hypothetical protein
MPFADDPSHRCSGVPSAPRQGLPEDPPDIGARPDAGSVAAAPAAIWTCPTCCEPVATRFCPRCDEEPLEPLDLTLRGVWEKVLHGLTTIDARVIRTTRRLIAHPGALALDWTRGTRRQYVARIQLFLLANVIFFAAQWVTGAKVFSTSLDSHLHGQDWSALARSLVADRIGAAGLLLEQYAPVFDRAALFNAKSLIILMTVPFAAALPVVFRAARRPAMLHMIFALHLYTVLLLIFCLALLAAGASDWADLGGLATPAVDRVLSVLIVLGCAVYLFEATGAVYGARGPARVLKVVVLSLLVAALVPGYRFITFLITLYGTT